MPEPEMHSVQLDGMSSATIVCDECVYHADTHSTAEIPAVLGNAAMHAMTYGHIVHEHITRDVTVNPGP